MGLFRNGSLAQFQSLLSVVQSTSRAPNTNQYQWLETRRNHEAPLICVSPSPQKWQEAAGISQEVLWCGFFPYKVTTNRRSVKKARPTNARAEHPPRSPTDTSKVMQECCALSVGLHLHFSQTSQASQLSASAKHPMPLHKATLQKNTTCLHSTKYPLTCLL